MLSESDSSILCNNYEDLSLVTKCCPLLPVRWGQLRMSFSGYEIHDDRELLSLLEVAVFYVVSTAAWPGTWRSHMSVHARAHLV